MKPWADEGSSSNSASMSPTIPTPTYPNGVRMTSSGSKGSPAGKLPSRRTGDSRHVIPRSAEVHTVARPSTSV